MAHSAALGRPVVYLCTGKSCRKLKRESRELRAALADVAEIREVDCQSICDGPVVGTAVDGELEWFRAVDSEKSRRQLRELLEGEGEPGKSLKKRHLRKRSGELR
ncbi:MAG: (2Fe-2S) ferredoxin domain-containing protein [Vicinamibacterales bacterium]